MHDSPGAVSEFSDDLNAHTEAANCRVPMGQLSENMAKDKGIKRTDQDAFAASSYQKAIKAQAAGLFKEEIHPVTVKYVDLKTDEEKTITVDKDDGVRDGITAESLAKIHVVHKRVFCVLGLPDSRLSYEAVVQRQSRDNRFVFLAALLLCVSVDPPKHWVQPTLNSSLSSDPLASGLMTSSSLCSFT